MTECDVLIVGAGIAGATAAYYLKKKSPELNVMVIEAKDRVGGKNSFPIEPDLIYKSSFSR